MKSIKIIAIYVFLTMIALNINYALHYYSIDKVSLADQFYWQSINDVVVDNSNDKVQTVTVSSSLKSPTRPISSKQSFYIVTRDSYHIIW